MITIFRKELKDILRWTPLGMIVIGVLCWQQIPGDLNECRNVPSSIAISVVIGSSLFALALGLLQSFFDLRTDTRAFLLHRPITARNIFWGKLLAGFVAHVLTWAIPLLLAAVYLESLGPERLPVTWSDVILPAVCCLVSFVFHPAAIWMACRDARWVGTKCLPMVLSLMVCVAGGSMLNFFSLLPGWASAISVLILAILACVIIAAAKHALTHQSFLPAPAAEESWSWSNTIGLGAASTVVTVMVVVFVMIPLMARQHTLPLKSRRLAASVAGPLWEIEETWKSPRSWEDEPNLRTGRQLTGEVKNASFAKLDETWREQSIVTLTISSAQYSSGFFGGYQYLSTSASKDHGGQVFLFQRDRRILLYGRLSGWLGTVTPQGFFEPNETPQGAFKKVTPLDHHIGSNNNYTSLGGQRLLADDHGVYQLDVDARRIRQLADAPTAAMAITLPSDEQPWGALWTRGDQTVRRFSIRPQTEDQTLPSIDSELVKATHNYPLANVEITPAGQWSVDWIDKPDKTLLSASSATDDNVVFITQNRSQERTWRVAAPDGSLVESGELPAVEITETSFLIESFMFPPALIAGSVIVMWTIDPNSYRAGGAPDWGWLTIALHALIGGAGAFLLARSRLRSWQVQVIWLITGLMVGVSAWLAVIAIYARPVVEDCASCQRRRRVDTDRCEHCGADWDVPDGEEIELIGPRNFTPTSAQPAATQ